MIHTGKEQWIAIALETTPGTAGTNKTYIPVTSSTFKAVTEPMFDESIIGVRDKNTNSILGPSRGEGDVEFNLDAKLAPYLLWPTLGTLNTTTVATGVYKHTITRKNDSLPKTFTVFNYDSVDTRQYTYGAINTAELAIATDSPISLKTNILSQFPTSGTGTPTYIDRTILASYNVKVQFGSGSTGSAALTAAAAAANSPITSFNVKFDNMAEAYYGFNDRSARGIGVKEFEVTGDYIQFYEATTDRSFYENQIDGSDAVRAMIVTVTGPLISGTNYEQIIFKFPSVRLSDRTIDTAAANFITENPSFVALYDNSTTSSVTVEVVNATATIN